MGIGRSPCRPEDLEQMEASPETFQPGAPSIDERHTGTGDELPDDVRDEDLSPSGAPADAGGDVDRRAEEQLVLGDRLADVETDAHVDREIGMRPAMVREEIGRPSG